MKDLILKSLSNINSINNFFSGIATVFMLHRVHPFELGSLLPNENMKVSPYFLEKFIIQLKSQGYDFISLNRLYDILINSIKVKKQIIFTLDDGYRDNYEIAFPIFKKHNIPFTIYICTSFPEKTAHLWWHVLEDLIIQNSELVLSDGSRFKCNTENEKIDTFLKIRGKIISFDQSDFLNKLNDLFIEYKINWLSKCSELSMSWAQIIELSKENLVTIGGHTNNHFALNKLSQAEIMDEIVVANKLLEKRIGTKIEHFAYPFGTKNEIFQRECDIVKGLGFKTAATARCGTIYPKHRNYLYCLPRIMLTENLDILDIGKIRRKRMVTI